MVDVNPSAVCIRLHTALKHVSEIEGVDLHDIADQLHTDLDYLNSLPQQEKAPKMKLLRAAVEELDINPLYLATGRGAFTLKEDAK